MNLLPSSSLTKQLFWAAFALILCLGLGYRLGNLSQQFTYIDELHVLQQGQLTRTASSPDYSLNGTSVWQQVYLFCQSPTITYGPGQFFLTFLLLDAQDPFTPANLLKARWVTALFGILVLVGACALFWPKDKTSSSQWWAFLVALLILAFSENLILQARFAYSYQASVAAVIGALLILRRWQAESRGWNLLAGLGLAICLSMGFQVIPVLLAMLAWVGFCQLRRYPLVKQKTLWLVSMVALFVPPLIMAGILIKLFVADKLGRAIPWWIEAYSASKGAIKQADTYWQQIVYLFDQPQDLPIYLLLILFVAASSAGAVRWSLLPEKPKIWYQEQTLALAGVTMSWVLFFLGKTAMSPTRQVLHLLPLYGVLLYPLGVLSAYAIPKASVRTTLAAVIVGSWILWQGMGLTPFWERNQEIYTRQALAPLVQDPAVKALVAADFEYPRAIFYIRPLLDSLGVKHYSYTNRSQVQEPAWLVSDFAHDWSELNGQSYFDYTDQRPSDTEPSQSITHFPNQIKVKKVRPATAGDLEWMLTYPELHPDPRFRTEIRNWAAKAEDKQALFDLINPNFQADKGEWEGLKWAWLAHKQKYGLM